jgi:hypothetical protein
VVVWLNGPFGVGTSTTARLLATRGGPALAFDPGLVATFLQSVVGQPVHDLSSLPEGRDVLVSGTVDQVRKRRRGRNLVVPVNLLEREWAEEVFDRVGAAGVPQRHVLLHADEPVLRWRVQQDERAPTPLLWRLEAIGRYRAAEEWLRGLGPVVDTTGLTAEQVAERVEPLVTAPEPGPGS